MTKYICHYCEAQIEGELPFDCPSCGKHLTRVIESLVGLLTAIAEQAYQDIVKKEDEEFLKRVESLVQKDCPVGG